MEDEQSNRTVPSSPRALSADVAESLALEVEQAKQRGWTQADLQRHFKQLGLTAATYKAALRGEQVQESVCSQLSALSVIGLPDAPAVASAVDIRRHIEWLIEPALGVYDDALIEIAYDGPGRGPTAARLFGLDEIDQAVAFAVTQNNQRSNVYIGAALRLPDANRTGRCSAEDFYVATAVPIDIDKNYDDTRARMAAVCEDGLVVTTGLVPERRSQHWARLTEPCDSDIEFGGAFAALVHHTGADMAVKDAARIMRLGGTVSYPNARKIAAGYCTELTSVSINERAKPSSIEALTALAPGEGPSEHRDFSHRPAGSGIERGGKFGQLVVNGRELFFRDLLLRHLSDYQAQNGADPSEAELFDLAFEQFVREADNTDARWTSDDGQKELRKRATNTLRRLRIGRLARVGLYSIDTEAGKDEALAVAANRAQTHPAEPPQEAPQRSRAPGPALINGADFLDRKLKPRPWFVPEMVPGAQVTTLDGDGGLGKSTLGLQLCVASSTGRTWLGQPVQRGATIYLASEDDEDEIHRRLDSLCAHFRVGMEDLTDLHVWPLAEHDPALVSATRDDGVEPTDRWRELEAFIAEIKPVALVLDSRADVFGGNEVSRSQARGFIGMLRALAVRNQLTVLMLAHPSLSGMSSGTGSSGSTHWRNSVRAALYLTRPQSEGDEPTDPDKRVLEVKKSNYGPSGLVLKLRWSVGAFEVDGGGGVAAGPADRAVAAAVVDAKFLQMLTLYNAQGRFVCDKAGHSFAPSVFAKDPAADGVTKSGFNGAMNRLFAADAIAVEMSGPPSRQIRRLVRKFSGAPS